MRRHSFYTPLIFCFSGFLVFPLLSQAQQTGPFTSPFENTELQPQGFLEQDSGRIAPDTLPTVDIETLAVPPLTIIEEEIPSEYSLARCEAQKSLIEINQEVTWGYTIIGAYIEVRWLGETIDGATEKEISTSYPNPGIYSGELLVTRYDGSSETIFCGTVEVTTPPLSLQCSPSQSFIRTGSCVTWWVDVEAGSKAYSIDWSGHRAIDPQTNERFEACYTQSGSYPSDVEVRTTDESRTIYCGSVTVMDNLPQEDPSHNQNKSGISLKPGEILKGSCSADITVTPKDTLVTWSAETSRTIPDQALTWHGHNMKTGVGVEQEVIYEEKGVYSAGFSVRTDDGSLYTFPCSHHVSIIEPYPKDTPGSVLFWIRSSILALLFIIWIPGILRVIKKYKKKN